MRLTFLGTGASGGTPGEGRWLRLTAVEVPHDRDGPLPDLRMAVHRR